MRILIVNTVPTERNGITNVIRNLYGAMDRRGMHFDIVSINKPDEEMCDSLQKCGMRLAVLSRSIYHPFRYILQLKKTIQKGKYDAIHVHGNSATMALEMVAAWMAGCKVRIAHCHSTTCKFMTVHRLMKPIFDVLVTHRLACGADAGKWLYGNKEFVVINNGIDTDRFVFRQENRQQIRAQYNIEQRKTVIGHVGTFDQNKNQDFLVDILKQLMQSDENYQLMLLGEGNQRTAVEEKAHMLGLVGNVIFVGTTEQVAEHLAACDLIVMPSKYEGLPLSLIEQQANGLQCIVSENITREVDKTGNLTFLPLEDGAQRWAEKVRILDLSKDREKISQTAIEKIKACGYDVHTEAARMSEYYKQVIGR